MPRKPGRPRKVDAWQMLAVRCPPELLERLEARTAAMQAARPGITRADVLREALANWLSPASPPKPRPPPPATPIPGALD